MTHEQHVQALEDLLDRAMNIGYAALIGLHKLNERVFHDTHKTCLDDLQEEIAALEAKVEDGYQ